MNELKLDEDVVFEKSQVAEVIERICVQRAKHLDDAVFGEIKEIIKEHEHITVVNLNEKAIVDALEKQTPKKLRVDDESWICCANCDETFYLHNKFNKMNKYCGNCGQALDWSGTNG